VLVGDDVAVGADDEAAADDGDLAAFSAAEDFFYGANVDERGRDLVFGLDNVVLRTQPAGCAAAQRYYGNE